MSEEAEEQEDKEEEEDEEETVEELYGDDNELTESDLFDADDEEETYIVDSEDEEASEEEEIEDVSEELEEDIPNDDEALEEASEMSLTGSTTEDDFGEVESTDDIMDDDEVEEEEEVDDEETDDKDEEEESESDEEEEISEENSKEGPGALPPVLVKGELMRKLDFSNGSKYNYCFKGVNKKGCNADFAKERCAAVRDYYGCLTRERGCQFRFKQKPKKCCLMYSCWARQEETTSLATTETEEDSSESTTISVEEEETTEGEEHEDEGFLKELNERYGPAGEDEEEIEEEQDELDEEEEVEVTEEKSGSEETEEEAEEETDEETEEETSAVTSSEDVGDKEDEIEDAMVESSADYPSSEEIEKDQRDAEVSQCLEGNVEESVCREESRTWCLKQQCFGVTPGQCQINSENDKCCMRHICDESQRLEYEDEEKTETVTEKDYKESTTTTYVVEIKESDDDEVLNRIILGDDDEKSEEEDEDGGSGDEIKEILGEDLDKDRYNFHRSLKENVIGVSDVHKKIVTDIKEGETIVHYFYRGVSDLTDALRPHHCAPSPLCMVSGSVSSLTRLSLLSLVRLS